MNDPLKIIRNGRVIQEIYDEALLDEKYEKDDGGSFIIVRGRKVVPPSLQNEILTAVYREVRGGLGRDKFYAYLSERYIGISRRTTMEFLRNIEQRQIHLKPVKGFVSRTKPIVGEKVKDYLQIDLADFSRISAFNSGYKYLLVIIDIFSKYVMVSKLKKKTPVQIREGIKYHLSATSFKPHIIQSDNGGEFGGEFKEWCKSEGIQLRHSLSHTPQSQGGVERVIGTLKRRLLTKRWVDEIDRIVEIYNNSVHSTTQFKPITLFEEHGEDKAKFEKALSRINIVKRAREREDLAKVKTSSLGGVLKVGDSVRILTKEFVAEHRKKKIIQWSEEIFKIRKISKIKKYTLATDVYYVEGKLKKAFIRSKLQKINTSKLQSILLDTPTVPRISSLPKRTRKFYTPYDEKEWELKK